MPLWDTSGIKPKHLSTEGKKEVVATNQGWVKRQTYTDTHGNLRKKDEILVSIGGLSESTTMALPDISSISLSDTNPSTDVLTFLFVTYDEIVHYGSGTNNWIITIANTAGGAAGLLAHSNSGIAQNVQYPIEGANNTLRFAFTPSTTGTYKVQAQNVANATLGFQSIYADDNPSGQANLTITSAVSNTLGTFIVS